MYDFHSRLIPYPQSVVMDSGMVEIAQVSQPHFTFTYDRMDSDIFHSAVRTIADAFADRAMIRTWDSDATYILRLVVNPADPAFVDLGKAEAYCIDITDSGARICGVDDAGAFYGAVTFAKLLMVEGDRVLLPKGRILDYPDFPHRGNFIECRYGTEFKTLAEWKDDIDYFAALKFNQLIIGIHGCWNYQYDMAPQEYLYVPVKTYPQLETRKAIKYYSVREEKWVVGENLLPTIFEEDFLGEIIAYGKTKNITVTPLFNSLGHNTYLPRMFPEAAAKNPDGTPTGYGFCTNAEATYDVIFTIYDEIIERYLRPNGIDSIHIGMDEVGKSYICHCAKCEGQAHADLMVEYIICICKHLKAMGMKHIYIYHDMLYNSFNIVNEALKERFIKEGIYDEVVLDWWSYEDPKKLFWGRAAGVNHLFRSIAKPFTGYYHWVIPTDSNDNVRAMAMLAKEQQFEGMNAYGIYEPSLDKNFYCLSESCWNVEKAQDKVDFNRRYAAYRFPNHAVDAVYALDALEDIMKDETGELYMNRACYRFEYYHYSYKKANVEYPQIFPGNALKFLYTDESTYLSYFRYLKEKALVALDFFEKKTGLNSFYADVWHLTAMHYYILADEYQAMHRIDTDYPAGRMSAQEVVAEFRRLLTQNEALMKLAEEVRSSARAYTYLRNQSVFRQYYLDSIAYIENALARGEKPAFRVMDFEAQKSAPFDFIK